MKTHIILISFILIFTAGCRYYHYPVKQGNMTILTLDGTPFQRGFFHGKFMKEEIDTIIHRWEKIVEESFETDFNTVIDSFFEKSTMVDTIKKYCTELLEEVKGIAIGSKQDFQVILALQMSEEIEQAGDYLFSSRCTSISTSQTSTFPTIVAQNMDPPAFLHGFPLLLHIRDIKTKTESYVYTFPGFIGLCGMSENVAVTCNGMSMLNHCTDALPVTFILRCLLSQKNEYEAFSFIQQVPHANPQCYTIGGFLEAKCFECSANSVNEFYPFKNQNITLHTNFAASNRDFNQKYIKLLAEYGKTINDPYFCPRYFLAFDEIKAASFKMNIPNIQHILSLTTPEIHPICNDETYGCLIMEMKENPTLHIASGKPNETEFITFQINKP
jgi:isopenicillin-N N-acyltransferase like protein